VTLTFRPEEHVRKRAEFEQIYQLGIKHSGRLMAVFASPNQTTAARLGIAATKKMGSAVERNRAKRLVRELFRHYKPAVGLDLVVIPRRVILSAPYDTIEAEFKSLVSRCDSSRNRRKVGGLESGAGADPSL
jgi:ribonuclease P protein component